jgi:hypothetical protein
VTHVAHFLAEPLADLPARRRGSVRRTSHVDMVTGGGVLELRGHAEQDGTSAASCVAVVGDGRRLLSLDVDPAPDGDQASALVGRVVGRAFRAAVDLVCEPGSLPSVLLRELPVAALLSGYGTLYAGHLPAPISDEVRRGLPVDICAGWATPASLMVHIGREREIPTPDGPPAPDDAQGWHLMPPLEPGSMRRQRLVERTGADVWAMFRDTYARPDGVTTVLHEYSVEATLTGDGVGSGSGDDGGTERFVSCVATPRVLPWAECPGAAASAGRLVGRRLDELAGLVRDELIGTSTCTHLNDLLASLSQAEQLVESPSVGRAR